MRSAAAAIAWEFRQRHRWGLIALACYLVALGTIRLLILAPATQPVDLEHSRSMWFLVLIPLTAAVLYLLTMFTFGLSGDVAARESMYPVRLFTLPVTTAELAGWPMLYGAMSMSGLWLATALFALRPSGIDVPLLWPAIFAATSLAWTQALTWMPYGLRGMRVIVAMLWLSSTDAVVIVAIQYKVAEPAMVAFLLPQVPLAYLAARSAVARSRRGDVPDWLAAFRRFGEGAASSPRHRRPFASPGSAQVWFEWWRFGMSLPALVGLLLPFELALLFIPGAPQSLIFFTLVGVLLTPPFMAAFAAATVRSSNPHVPESVNLTPFIATRPMNGPALIGAKLKATIWSTLATWLLVLVAVPIALILSGRGPVVIERAREFIAEIGMPRAVVFLLLVLTGLLASTWKQLVQSLYIGLSGREWAVKASVALALTFLCLIGPIALWIDENSRVRVALWDGIPLILAVLVCLKMSAAAWIATRLYRSRVLSDRTLVTGAACWLVTVFALYGLLVWLVSTVLIAHYLFLLVAILAIPLARLSAAPLALAWNRHR